MIIVNEIKINHEQLLEEVATLRSAIALFKPYTTGYVREIASVLDKGNSDFLSEVKKTLGNMSDSVAPQLLEDLVQIEGMITNATTTFQETDLAIAKELDQKR